MKDLQRSEPVSMYAALTSAIVGTINVLGMIFNWSTDLIAALNLCLVAWIGVGAWVVRARVTPVTR